ncbi:hypothetical protein L6654_40280 [Bradyrhizobium sp. WYCCWR 13023]|uniref:Secreted protein n=1 Tax=Bradyrhizobium zhengyangense TaxID=2911009 RepID=A0A9X1RLI3_9BRAD|nr:hypothetical protein [Bradyrhizobium zhengyangense]MCG2632829.1 hypothetical protein [Bradyrhizobium zhengyangense]MCG2645622.1 hypothetical protein [Bradyrhizobium zhengyangense]MCG2673187.1 hypothetical protein [Bradyrhizobium zhengyangense]
MRTMMTSVIALLTLVSLTAGVKAESCPPGTVQVCPPPSKTRPPGGPPAWCRCEGPPGSPTWGGRAEIHKKNVPTVKPGKSPGPND